VYEKERLFYIILFKSRLESRTAMDRDKNRTIFRDYTNVNDGPILQVKLIAATVVKIIYRSNHTQNKR